MAKYTREAGVRTLERTIGAVCRAVAVKVAENNKKDKKTFLRGKPRQEEVSVREHAGDSDKEFDHKGNLKIDVVLPPELPIVIDEAAVEDILGVCF